MNREAKEVREVSPGYELTAATPTIPEGYKKTDVGVIPADWNVFRLDEHFLIYAGGDVPKHSLSNIQSEKHPFPIFANAIKDKGLYGFTNQKRSNPDSLTITARGFLGHAEYREEPFFPIVRLLVLEPEGTVDAKFATFAINDRVNFSIESTGVPQLTAPQVGKYTIAAPADIKEQRAIATALSDVDALLDELGRLIAKKRDIKQATMQQLLTGQTRLPGFEGEWEVSPLGDITTFLSGGTPPRSNESYWKGDIPWISATSLRTFYIWRSDSSVTKEAVAAGSKMAPVGSILLLVRGSALHNEILAGLVTNPVCFNQDVKALIPQRGICGKFLTFVLHGRAENLLKLVSSAGNTAGVLDTKLLKAFEIHLPPFEEQAAIATALSDIDTEIQALKHHRTKSAALKKAMMQDLLTGRIRL